jgi:hypothetical protein
MKSIQINGKNYVKARDLAEDLGYTTDYIGQLCRGGKVDAELVGRTWYVDPESVHSHKATRYRSTKAKSQEAVKIAIHRLKDESPARSVGSSPTTVHLTTHSYEEDDAELIPTLRRHETQDAPVARHITPRVVEKTESDKRAGANKVHVVSAPPLKVEKERDTSVSFKGSVPVHVLDALDDDGEPELRELESVLSEVAIPEPKTAGVRVHSADGEVRSRSLKSAATVAPTPAYSIRYVVWSVGVITTCAFLLLVSLLSLETVTIATQSGVEHRYGFDFRETSASLFRGLK